MFAVAIALLIVAVTLGIGADITDSLASNYVNNTLTTNQVDNESWAAQNATAYTFANPDRVDGTSIVVMNATTIVAAGNYTLVTTTPANIVLINGSELYNGTSLNISYSYNSVGRTITQEPFDNGTASLAELSSWLPTIALVLAAAMIIGVIVLFFRRRM